MKQRMAEFKIEEATAFIKLAALSSRKKYFSEAAWGQADEAREKETDHSRMWQAREDGSVCRYRKALLRDPAGEIPGSSFGRSLESAIGRSQRRRA